MRAERDHRVASDMAPIRSPHRSDTLNRDILEDRLGRQYARQRLGIEKDHEAQVFGHLEYRSPSAVRGSILPADGQISSLILSALSPEQADIRRQRLGQLAADAEGLASKPRDATYQGFERILKQVEELARLQIARS
jgi:hypothetical protein